MLLYFALTTLVILNLLNRQQCSLIDMFLWKFYVVYVTLDVKLIMAKTTLVFNTMFFFLSMIAQILIKESFIAFFLHDGKYYHSRLSVLVYILTLDSMLSDIFLHLSSERAYKSGKNWNWCSKHKSAEFTFTSTLTK